MKIYLLTQNIVNGYDIYDSVVVIAENEEEAKKIHPSKYVTHIKDNKWMGTYRRDNHEEYETENDRYKSWVHFEDIDKIEVKYLGEAKEGSKKGVICASFNAG